MMRAVLEEVKTGCGIATILREEDQQGSGIVQLCNWGIVGKRSSVLSVKMKSTSNGGHERLILHYRTTIQRFGDLTLVSICNRVSEN